MFQKVRTLFNRKGSSDAPLPQEVPTIIAPEQPFYVVGDIHGCHDMLSRLLDQITSDAVGEEVLVFVGDAIDRGPHAAKVLDRLFELSHAKPQKTVTLMGNHERMMLEFIDDPSDRGARWLQFGGIETLASFGITGVSQRPDAEDALDIADALEAALPDGMLAWLRALPLCWRSGNVCVVHAAMDPQRSYEEQNEATLLWGHRTFFTQPRADDLCVVHGHTIVSEPTITGGRIAIDTGAYRGGRLTAARIDTDQARFLQA